MPNDSREKYPIFTALGTNQKFLTNDEAVVAGRDARIQSIWPFIVRRSRQFFKSLKPRERANFDPEDTALELWAAIAEKDHQWEPERGQYITFAGAIIERELCEIRDRARTVESPRNSTCRMKEYIREEEAGTINSRRQATANDIRRTGAGATGLSNERGDIGIPERNPSDPPVTLAAEEIDAERLDAITMAIPQLEPYEAAVVGRLAGLWGRTRQTLFWVAWSTGRDMAEVRKVRSVACRKIHDILVSLNHPVANFDN